MVGKKATTYQEIIPIFILCLIIFQLTVPLIDSLQDINVKLVAYSDCAKNMMDYAFLGKVYNFSACYLNKLNNTNVTLPDCKKIDGKIVCKYNNKIYIFNLGNMSQWNMVEK